MQFIPITQTVSQADRDLFVSDVHVVANIGARDALTVQEGDLCKVTGDKTYIYDGATWLTLNDNNGNVISVNNINPVNGNVSLTSANIPENTNLYYTNLRVRNEIRSIMTTRGDLLTRDNAAALVRIPIGTNGQCLKSNGNDPSWGQINLQEILNMTPSERLNFSIPGNSSVNMLDWLMNNSNILDNLITPNNLPDINPFFWGTRGDADYGQWKIQNNNANAANIDKVNIIHGANFIIWQFIRTLINNIMDDNLNNGTALVRPLGINHDQQGGRHK